MFCRHILLTNKLGLNGFYLYREEYALLGLLRLLTLEDSSVGESPRGDTTLAELRGGSRRTNEEGNYPPNLSLKFLKVSVYI